MMFYLFGRCCYDGEGGISIVDLDCYTVYNK